MEVSRREILKTAAFGAGALVLGPLAGRRAYAIHGDHQGQQSPVVTELAPGLFMISGLGGNIGLMSGSDGKLVVDTGIPPATADLMKLVEATGGSGTAQRVINTHFHGDHTGGNEAFGKAGVKLLSHDNCRLRLSTEQNNEFFNRKTPPSPEAALPQTTFSEKMTMFVNGDEIRMTYVPTAHTDNDIMLHFVKANVLHTGDLLFNGAYPYIDYSAGGTILGMIRACDVILATADDKTKIIPGHGPLGNKADVQAEKAMMMDIVATIEPLVKAGKSEAEVVAAKPTAKYDAKYGTGFINGENFTKLVYRTLKPA